MTRKTHVALVAVLLASGPCLASQAAVKAGSAYQMTKTVQWNPDGSVTITRFGTHTDRDGIYRDNATIQEAMSLYAERRAGVPIEVWVSRSSDGTAVVTAKEYVVQHVDSPNGPLPPTPP